MLEEYYRFNMLCMSAHKYKDIPGQSAEGPLAAYSPMLVHISLIHQ